MDANNDEGEQEEKRKIRLKKQLKKPKNKKTRSDLIDFSIISSHNIGNLRAVVSEGGPRGLCPCHKMTGAVPPWSCFQLTLMRGLNDAIYLILKIRLRAWQSFDDATILRTLRRGIE